MQLAMIHPSVATPRHQLATGTPRPEFCLAPISSTSFPISYVSPPICCGLHLPSSVTYALSPLATPQYRQAARPLPAQLRLNPAQLRLIPAQPRIILAQLRRTLAQLHLTPISYASPPIFCGLHPPFSVIYASPPLATPQYR